MNQGFGFFELRTGDLSRAKAFYAELFGWKVNDLPLPGVRFALVETAGAPGGILETKAEPPAWLSYATVEALDQKIEQARALGGTVLQPRTEVPGQGSYAIIGDPTGARFAFWQPQAGK